MNSLAALAQYTSIKIVWQYLVLDILLTAGFALFLKWFFIKFGVSLSNRSRLANNFVAIAVTTALVITIVKSSLALSLGLVGALSIVRFRTAIKDPEELAYLFLSIALGLGFGAGQREVTIISFVVILFVLWVQHRLSLRQQVKNNLYLTIKVGKSAKTEEMLALISEHTLFFDLQRLETDKSSIQLAGLVEFGKSDDLSLLTQALEKKYSPVTVTFVDVSSLS